MPYIVTTTCFPSRNAKQVADRYLAALKQHPPDESIGTALSPAVIATHEGNKSIQLFEVKPGKLEEAFFRAMKIMTIVREAEGLTYSVTVQLNGDEAMTLAGAKPPDKF